MEAGCCSYFRKLIFLKKGQRNLKGINVMSNIWISQVGSIQLGAKRIERNQRELIGGKLGNQRQRPSKRTNLKKKKSLKRAPNPSATLHYQQTEY